MKAAKQTEKTEKRADLLWRTRAFFSGLARLEPLVEIEMARLERLYNGVNADRSNIVAETASALPKIIRTTSFERLCGLLKKQIYPSITQEELAERVVKLYNDHIKKMMKHIIEAYPESSGDLPILAMNYFINGPVGKKPDPELLKMQDELESMQENAKKVLSSRKINGSAFRLLKSITRVYEESDYYSFALEVFRRIN